MPDATSLLQTRDPATGAVTFDFSGHVKATGLDLPLAAGTNPPNTSRIRWLRDSDGAAVAHITSFQSGSTSQELDLGVDATDAITQGVWIFVQSKNDTTLFLSHDSSGVGTLPIRKVVSRVLQQDGTGLADRTIFDSLGQSSFPQLTSVSKIKTSRGNVNLSWSGSAASGVATISHGLGVTPTAVAVVMRGIGTAGVFAISGAYGASTFQVQGSTTGAPLTATLTCDWIAYS